MILLGGLVISMSSLFGSRVSAKIKQLAINLYLCPPVFLTCNNAFESASVVCLFSTITLILCIRASSKIVRQIIQCVAISVIGLHSIWRIRNDSVHTNQFTSSVQFGSSSCGIKRFRIRSKERVPLILVEHLVPIVRNLRDLPLRKLNSFHAISKKEAAYSGRVSYQNRRTFLSPAICNTMITWFDAVSFQIPF